MRLGHHRQATPFTPSFGETTYIAFGNQDCGEVLAAANIIVRKFQDVNGDYDANDAGEGPLSGWHITITGTSGEALGKVYALDTDGSGVAAFLGVETGTWTISETPKVSHTVVGSVYTSGVAPLDPTSTDSPAAGATRTGLFVALDQTLKVDFFNQPKGTITVVKTVTDNVGNVGVAGWEFDLDGCGVHKDGDDRRQWHDRLDQPASRARTTSSRKWMRTRTGSASRPSATQVVNIGPGDEEAVTFHNRRDPGTTPETGETPTNTPTATNTPPTDETPTETATDTPPADATDTPTPTETSETAGEKTPGAGNEATPIAPDSGSGLAGGTSGTNMLFVLLGLAAITMGSGFLAIGRKRS